MSWIARSWEHLVRAIVGLLFCVVLLCCIWPAHASARAVAVIAPGQAAKPIGAAFDILEDPSQALTIEDLRGAAGRSLVPTDKDNTHFGFSDSAWWGRFTLRNPGDHAVTQIIEFGYPVIDRLEFYRPRDDGPGYRRQVTGDSVVGREFDIPGRKTLYRVTVPARSEATYYVRISGESILGFDATLYDPDGYYATGASEFDTSLIFFGVLLAAIFYSTAIFVIVRDESYLLFAVTIVGIMAYFASIWGYMGAYILPETTWLANTVIAGANCLILFAPTRFTRYFLRLADHAPRLCRVYCYLEIASGVLFFLSLIDFQLAQYLLRICCFIALAMTFGLSAWLWRSGVRYGKFFSFCWIYFCALSVIFSAERMGVLPAAHVFESVFRITFGAIALLFAALFAEKYRHMAQGKEKELRLARDEAIAASQAKSRFLAMMSHELRTPLNAVIGFSDILRMEAMGKLGNPKYKEYAQDIKDSGSHLLAIINDLLEISRIEAGQVELDEGPIVVRALVRRCLRIVEDRAQQNGLVLLSHMGDDLPILIGDETRIQQVLINLLYNAVKFTPSGGQVTLDVALTARGEYRFAIIDTGIGIAEEDRERILEPFTQVASHLTRKHDGVGLGLAIAKSILDLHGARLEVLTGAGGTGTTFAILFPMSRVERQAA